METVYVYSSSHWLVGFIGFLAFVIPAVKILHKAGYSGWWLLTAFVPFLNVIMLWIFAFARWPIEERTVSR